MEAEELVKPNKSLKVWAEIISECWWAGQFSAHLYESIFQPFLHRAFTPLISLYNFFSSLGMILKRKDIHRNLQA